MNLIEVKNISKKFGKVVIIDDLSFVLKEGESISIVGRNGVGKTTLMNILVGLQKCDDGEIVINDPSHDGCIAMQFQTPNLPEEFKAISLIKYYKLQYDGFITNEEINDLIDIFEIKNHLNTKIKKLSGGLKQRINLLLTMLKKTKVIILDEFISGLDIISVEKIVKFLEKLKSEKKVSFIIISHQPEEVRRLTDRILVLKNGKIENEYITSEVNKKYDGKFNKFFLEVLNE